MGRAGASRVAAVVALAVAATGNALAGEVLTDQQAPSPALGRPLTYAVYLPDEAARGAGPLPVAYLLHGYGGGQREWLQGGRLEALLDRLIEEGAIAPLIAVMPEAGKSWYVDSAEFGGPGDYQTAIARDLVRHVDATYPTSASRSGRAVAGLSMGGYGALNLAFRHPDVFGAVAALSPAIFAPAGASGRNRQLGGTPESLDRWYPRTFGDNFDPEIYAERSPFAMVAALADLATPPRILIAVGDDDFFKLYFGAVEMFVALKEAGVGLEFRVYDGDHTWDFWRTVAGEMFIFLDRARAPGG